MPRQGAPPRARFRPERGVEPNHLRGAEQENGAGIRHDTRAPPVDGQTWVSPDTLLHQTVWGLGPHHGRSWVAVQGRALAVEPQTWEAPVIGQRTSVGLDVHARSVVGCGLDEQTGEVLRSRLTPAHEQVIRWLQSLPGPVKVAYEAGPTGFGLARTLQSAGIDCLVAAPSRLLRPTGDRVKTDAKDALLLARLVAVGEVTAVAVPDEETEAARDLVRARDDVRCDLMSARHRVTHLLLRQGIVYAGGTPWTKVHEVYRLAILIRCPWG